MKDARNTGVIPFCRRALQDQILPSRLPSQKEELKRRTKEPQQFAAETDGTKCFSN